MTVEEYYKGYVGDNQIKTPCFIVDIEKLTKNLQCLKQVIEETKCHILLAQKCYSFFPTYPLVGQYLSGTTASGLYEAKLGSTYMGGETHVYSAAYRPEEMEEILQVCDHIIFNSLSQWERYKEQGIKSGKSFGLRINPQCSTQEGHEIYDPCGKFSRMGIIKEELDGHSLAGISGLHFHCLCEQDADALKITLKAVEDQFGSYLESPNIKWLNMGGGHHITRDGYDLQKLKQCITHMKEKYNVEVYLEPGEAVALNAGYLVSEVLDILHNGMEIAILDTSAACHMPDVLEMPYRPNVLGGSEPGEKAYTYRLGGPTCLAGDIIGDYSFEKPLQVGDKLILCDMAIYTMVKTNTFNGMKLPSIYTKNGDKIECTKEFGYEDFKSRLG